ncbi:hypothetical protein [Leucobacter denitrificans]|uniref:Uncharacterized protein n=1 Tax=Leucobacter denitrificans TaxID=683042 RepID=A0A7G9S3X4_9MICO|nr:hypothetical protein [Leucobacter denitrificans]QNN62549.1 hypothetical protein H9L06_09910 [Leucobacter denitrificans]
MSAERSPRKPRRAQRPAAEGVDPHPSEHPLTSRASEDRPEGWGDAQTKRTKKQGAGENDDRLKQDRPPHWG